MISHKETIYDSAVPIATSAISKTFSDSRLMPSALFGWKPMALMHQSQQMILMIERVVADDAPYI